MSVKSNTGRPKGSHIHHLLRKEAKSCSLPQWLWLWLDEIGGKDGDSRSEVIRKAIMFAYDLEPPSP